MFGTHYLHYFYARPQSDPTPRSKPTIRPYSDMNKKSLKIKLMFDIYLTNRAMKVFMRQTPKEPPPPSPPVNMYIRIKMRKKGV